MKTNSRAHGVTLTIERQILPLIPVLAILAAVPPAFAAESPTSFVLFDQVVTHRGDRQLYKNWDFQTDLATKANVPRDWLAPGSPLFDKGEYQFRVEVRRMERRWTAPMTIQFGWWNIPKDPVIRHSASPALELTHLEPPAAGKPWVYEQVGTVRSLDRNHTYYGAGPKRDENAPDWDWRRAFAPNSAYTMINPRTNDLDANHDGKITAAEYPDIEVHCVLTLHLPGSPLVASLAADAARLFPGGSFERRTIDTLAIQPWLKTVGDLDGDGRPDLVVGAAKGGGLMAYHNDGGSWRRELYDGTRSFSTDGEVADLDRDGRADIVAITWAPNGVVWYQNTLAGPVFHEITKETWHDVEVADLDGDGHPDLVGRNQKEWPAGDDSGNRLHLLWQRRDSDVVAFDETELPCPTGEGLLARDLDGDGDVDIMVNGHWFENLGKRRFAEHAYARPDDWSYPNTFIAIGDVDGNGRPDIVLSPSELKGGRYKIAWFEAPKNRRQEGWRAHVIVPDVEAVVHFVGVADFNGDGRADVTYAEMPQGAGDDEVKIMFNHGHRAAAGFVEDWRPFLVSVEGGHSLRVLDADGDGRPDLFGANWAHHGRDEHVRLWLNRLRGPSAGAVLPLDRWRRVVVDEDRPGKAVFVGALDVDGDGRRDITAGAWWYRNPGPGGQPWTRQSIGAPLYNYATAYDIDGDGDLDLFGTAWKGGKGDPRDPRLAWARNDGKGVLTVLPNLAVPDGREDFLQGVAFGRFHGGGLQAALSWHNGTGNGVQMVQAPADPAQGQWTWQRLPHPDQQEQLTAADIDSDGRVDLVLGTRWLRNTGTGWEPLVLSDSGSQPDRNRVGDLDGDGRPDVVVGFLGIGESAPLVWYERGEDATKPWREHLIAADVVGPMSLDLADVDGDGDLDVVVGEHNTKQPQRARLLVLENLDRARNWRPHVVSTGDEHHDGAQVVDIDGDGDLDIVSVGWTHARVVLYENGAVDASSRGSAKLPTAQGPAKSR